jgi:hypothetical protein
MEKLYYVFADIERFDAYFKDLDSAEMWAEIVSRDFTVCEISLNGTMLSKWLKGRPV